MRLQATTRRQRRLVTGWCCGKLMFYPATSKLYPNMVFYLGYTRTETRVVFECFHFDTCCNFLELMHPQPFCMSVFTAFSSVFGSVSQTSTAKRLLMTFCCIV